LKILSINVARPRLTAWKGMTVNTGIFKVPVAGRIKLRRVNFDGDRQADLSVHGGPDKAVYAYPSEHYEYWSRELPGVELPRGMFGENLTTEGLLESDVAVGKQFRVGSAVIIVTQPRFPCFKLAAKFRRDDIIQRFAESGRSGFYFSVVEEGEIGAGDNLEPLSREDTGLSISDVNRLYFRVNADIDLLRRAAQARMLPEGLRRLFQKRLEAATEHNERVSAVDETSHV